MPNLVEIEEVLSSSKGACDAVRKNFGQNILELTPISYT
jgi:hypothetical protein